MGLINNDLTLEKVRKDIDAMQANMGGTDIYAPLYYAMTNFL